MFSAKIHVSFLDDGIALQFPQRVNLFNGTSGTNANPNILKNKVSSCSKRTVIQVFTDLWHQHRMREYYSAVNKVVIKVIVLMTNYKLLANANE